MKFRFSAIKYWILSSTCFLLFSLHISFAQNNVRTEEYAGNFARTAATVLAPVYEPLAKQITVEYGLADKRGTGIDLGGGTGNLVAELSKKTPYMSWINADINPALPPYVKRAAEEAGVSDRVSAVVTDAQDLIFGDNFADIIVSRGSFQFWEDKVQAFSEIYRVLKPGGTAFIGRGFPDNLPVDVARSIREKHGSGPPYDIGETAIELENIMKSLNIEAYRIRIPHPPGSDGINYGIWLEFHK